MKHRVLQAKATKAVMSMVSYVGNSKPRLSATRIHRLLQLQRKIGNGAVLRMIQAKLEVSHPGDPYEREADQVAHRIVSMTAAGAQPAAQRAAIPEEEKDKSKPAQETSPRTIPATPNQQQEPLEEDEKSGQAKAFRAAEHEAPNGVHPHAEEAVSAASNSTGQPLPANLHRKFEQALGADLSAVRVHTGSQSVEANKAISARAYTTGNDIHFNQGQYNPESLEGQRLLAHEVVHTVQQSGGVGAPQFKLDVSIPRDTAEVGADSVVSVMPAAAQAPRAMVPTPSTSIQRYPMPAEEERNIPEEKLEGKPPQELQAMLGKKPEEEGEQSAVATTLPGAAPAIQRMPANSRLVQRLTAEEKKQDLQSDKYKDNGRLQSAFDNSPAMHLGESGDAVKLVQEGLRDAGFALPRSTKASGEMDGIFGQETFAALKAFQTQNGLDPDGIIGRNTMARLDALASAPGPSPPIPGGPPPSPPTPPVPTTVPVVITGGTELWHFNGATPPNYPLQQTLTANAGGTAGTFRWTILGGAGFADFSGSPTAVGRSVTLTSKLQSGALNDVQVRVDFTGVGGGTGAASLRTTVRAPQSMTPTGNVNNAIPRGWQSLIGYSIQDQFGTTLPRNVEINERWDNKPAIPDFPGTNWPSFPPSTPSGEGSAPVSPAGWSDNMNISDGIPPVRIPTSTAPGTGGPLVMHFRGHWQVGSPTIGSGKRVRSVTWRFFQDHGDHA